MAKHRYIIYHNDEWYLSHRVTCAGHTVSLTHPQIGDEFGEYSSHFGAAKSLRDSGFTLEVCGKDLFGFDRLRITERRYNMWFIIVCLIAPVVVGVMWEVWQAWASIAGRNN